MYTWVDPNYATRYMISVTISRLSNARVFTKKVPVFLQK